MKVERLTNLKRQATKILEALSKGERAVLENRTYRQDEAREKMKKWLR